MSAGNGWDDIDRQLGLSTRPFTPDPALLPPPVARTAAPYHEVIRINGTGRWHGHQPGMLRFGHRWWRRTWAVYVDGETVCRAFTEDGCARRWAKRS